MALDTAVTLGFLGLTALSFWVSFNMPRERWPFIQLFLFFSGLFGLFMSAATLYQIGLQPNETALKVIVRDHGLAAFSLFMGVFALALLSFFIDMSIKVFEELAGKKLVKK